MNDGTVPKTITPGQMKELCTALAQTVPSDLPYDRADALIRNKALLRDGTQALYYPVPAERQIVKPAAPKIIKPVSTIIRPTRPFDPAAVLGQGFTIWLGREDGDGLEGEEECDSRSFDLDSLDLSLLEPTTIFRRRESYTTSAEQIRRLKVERAEHIRLGPCFALTLRAEPEKYPEALKGKATFWDGLTLRSPDGDRCSVYSIWLDGRVVLYYRRHGGDRDADNPSALLANKHLALATPA